MHVSAAAPLFRKFAVIALATLGVVSVARADKPAESDRQTPFVASVLSHFAAWDADHNGKLTVDEVDVLLKNPAITGDDAAAVSALKLVTRAKKDLPDLTPDYFRQYNATVIGSLKKETGGDNVDATTAAEGGARDTGAAKPIDSAAKWDRYFVAGKKRLADAAGAQWTGADFSIDKIKQGALGDCFFVASLGSIAVHRPEQIQHLVQQLPDGSYKANFPGVAPFTFPKLTDAQIAISGTSGPGAFLAIFEQAFGKYRSELAGKSIDVDGTDVLYRGGDSAPTLRALTSHDTKRISFPKTVEAREAGRDKVLPEVRQLLVYNIEHHLAITGGGVVGVSAKDAAKAKTPEGTLPIDPPDILRSHVYVIVGYDAKTDKVTIWNPHGQTFHPKGEPGLQNGYVTEAGQFTLPLTEAYQFYGSFTFETEKPAGAADTKKKDEA